VDFTKPLPTPLRMLMQNRPPLFLGCGLARDLTPHLAHKAGVPAYSKKTAPHGVFRGANPRSSLYNLIFKFKDGKRIP
jgi:hypothetical protein